MGQIPYLNKDHDRLEGVRKNCRRWAAMNVVKSIRPEGMKLQGRNILECLCPVFQEYRII